ncbi:MAG: antitoxin VapB family protein [Gemmatimonadaceae bacterium]|nr:antitoxin VapB family protein [Gemmatimonadaceae bacterium]
MASRTISLDLAAYEALRRRKRAGQSFSDVIKEHFVDGGTGAALLRTLERIGPVDRAVLDAVDAQIAARGDEPARARRR